MPGNYEVSCFYDVFGDRVLHNMWSEFIDVKMAGYGGSPGALPEQASKVIELTSGIRPYTRVMQGFSEAELSDLLTKEKPKVIMSHTPPYEVLDRTIGGRNKGTGALRIYLDNTGGTADEVNSVLCGHIHESGPLENNDAGRCSFRSANVARDQTDLHIVGEAETGMQAIAWRVNSNLAIVMDITLPGHRGIEATQYPRMLSGDCHCGVDDPRRRTIFL